MESNTPKFRLRLNLFDGLVLVLALAVGAFLLWNALKPQQPVTEESAVTSTTTIRYTVRFLKWPEGVSALLHEGDKLVDNIKNYQIGQVVSAEVVPAVSLVLNHDTHQYVLAEAPGYEDILVTVEAPGVIGDEAITLDGGYTLRVGATAYIRGEGYMASGPIIAIERGGQA